MLKAAILGNIGNEPEVRYSANGNAFLRFNVASNFRKYEGDGTYVDSTQWVRVTVAGRRVETLEPYLKKGMRVYVDGRLEARPWTDQQGTPQPGLEIFAAEVQFASPANTNDDQRPQQQAQQPRPQPAQRGREPVTPTRTPEERAERARAILDDDDDDSDLPF